MFCFSLQTFAGGVGDGGGNAQKSTRADLEEIVSSLYQQFWQISDSYYFGKTFKLTSEPLKPNLAEMTNKILGLPYFSITNFAKDYLYKLKFNIIDKSCYDGKEEKDASTEYKKFATICLSATRLSRFPKSTLKVVIIPLIFHEVAHQYGYQETEANAFQALAEIHLIYRPIYLSNLRSYIQCAFGSHFVKEKQKKDILELMSKFGDSFPIKVWPRFNVEHKQLILTACAAHSQNAGDNLERVFNGEGWKPQASGLLNDEENELINYSKHKAFSFFTLIHALKDPSIVFKRILLAQNQNARISGQYGSHDFKYILFLKYAYSTKTSNLISNVQRGSCNYFLFIKCKKQFIAFFLRLS